MHSCCVSNTKEVKCQKCECLPFPAVALSEDGHHAFSGAEHGTVDDDWSHLLSIS